MPVMDGDENMETQYQKDLWILRARIYAVLESLNVAERSLILNCHNAVNLEMLTTARKAMDVVNTLLTQLKGVKSL